MSAKANRTREAGNRDEGEGVVAISLKLYRNGAVGFIDWLGLLQLINMMAGVEMWRDVSYDYECLMRKSGWNMLQAQ